MKKYVPLLFLCLIAVGQPCAAQDNAGKFQQWKETREHRREAKKAMDAVPQDVVTDNFQGRDLLIYASPNMPSMGRRSMIVVLHGGMGNAVHIQTIIGQQMKDAADEGGYIIAYLNGSQATRRNAKFLAWNAGGGCCGQPAKNNVDDVAYITGAVSYLARKYGVDKERIFGMGHSNGAMMTQRLMCETDLYQAIIPISGPLNIDVKTCPKAKGRKIWAIHGDKDENVPIGGGPGTKGLTDVPYKSEIYAKEIFEASDALYRIDAVKGADHSLQHLADAIEQRETRTLAREAALFFGLAPK